MPSTATSEEICNSVAKRPKPLEHDDHARGAPAEHGLDPPHEARVVVDTLPLARRELLLGHRRVSSRVDGVDVVVVVVVGRRKTLRLAQQRRRDSRADRCATEEGQTALAVVHGPAGNAVTRLEGERGWSDDTRSRSCTA